MEGASDCGQPTDEASGSGGVVMELVTKDNQPMQSKWLLSGGMTKRKKYYGKSCSIIKVSSSVAMKKERKSCCRSVRFLEW